MSHEDYAQKLREVLTQKQLSDTLSFTIVKEEYAKALSEFQGDIYEKD